MHCEFDCRHQTCNFQEEPAAPASSAPVEPEATAVELTTSAEPAPEVEFVKDVPAESDAAPADEAVEEEVKEPEVATENLLESVVRVIPMSCTCALTDQIW